MFGKRGNKLAGTVGGCLKPNQEKKKKPKQEKNAELVLSQIIKLWKLNCSI